MRYLMLILLVLITGCTTISSRNARGISTQDLCAARMNSEALGNSSQNARRELGARGYNCGPKLFDALDEQDSSSRNKLREVSSRELCAVLSKNKALGNTSYYEAKRELGVRGYGCGPEFNNILNK